jgi:predicted O-methyltransferase YrrM
MIKNYLIYLLQVQNEHALHSPFVFDFYTKILKNKTSNTQFSTIERLKKNLLNEHETIEITDFGAGSRLNQSNRRKIKDLAKNTAKPLKFGQLFYHIIQYFNYKTIFDLGTSLGITTSFLASSSPDNQVFTFEGCPNTASIAQRNFNQLGLKNIKIIIGNLNETLEKTLQETEKLDFVFFDANHQYQPTMQYFEQCLTKKHEESCFVFDDIYWSAGMKKAWNEIKNHPEVMISIDLFWIGLVFFRKKQPKQHFILRF